MPLQALEAEDKHLHNRSPFFSAIAMHPTCACANIPGQLHSVHTSSNLPFRTQASKFSIGEKEVINNEAAQQRCQTNIQRESYKSPHKHGIFLKLGLPSGPLEPKLTMLRGPLEPLRRCLKRCNNVQDKYTRIV
eukprot:6068380-Amphidinium_carterae.2